MDLELRTFSMLNHLEPKNMMKHQTILLKYLMFKIIFVLLLINSISEHIFHSQKYEKLLFDMLSN